MNKSYGHDHMEKRARVAYEENCRRVKQHNEHAQNGKYSFEIRANHLADMSQSTYLKHFTRLTGDIHPHSERAKASQKSADHEEMLGSVHRDYDDGSVVPDSLDWRQLGYRTHPKNQMTCGSCYAFSITSAIEAQVFRRTGKVVPLSVQQIVDCSSAMGNGGCRGGSLGTTLKYLKSTKGLMRSVDYPYESEVTFPFDKPSYYDDMKKKSVFHFSIDHLSIPCSNNVVSINLHWPWLISQEEQFYHIKMKMP